MLIEDGQILLVRRAAPSFHGMWCVPCGHVAKGESLERAARREFKEETGLDVRIEGVCFVYLSYQIPDRPVLGVWHSGIREGGKLAAADDAVEARFFPLDAPPSNLAFVGDKLLIEKLRTQHERER